MSVKTRIIGIGNPLCGDDGIGVAVVERMQQAGLPAGVEAIDGGLGGLSLIDYFEDVPHVILVDAVDFAAPPGEIAHFQLADTKSELQDSLQQLHAGLAPLLALVDSLELCPLVDLVAVQPLHTAAGEPLSPLLRSRLEQVEATIQSLLT